MCSTIMLFPFVFQLEVGLNTSHEEEHISFISNGTYHSHFVKTSTWKKHPYVINVAKASTIAKMCGFEFLKQAAKSLFWPCEKRDFVLKSNRALSYYLKKLKFWGNISFIKK